MGSIPTNSTSYSERAVAPPGGGAFLFGTSGPRPLDIFLTYKNYRSLDDERQPDRLSAAEARKVIREIAADFERVVILPHAWIRMEERNISSEDVLKVVRKGVIVEGPYLSVRGDWRVELQGRASGDAVSVAIAIEWKTRLLVVTVIKDESRGKGKR